MAVVAAAGFVGVTEWNWLLQEQQQVVMVGGPGLATGTE